MKVAKKKIPIWLYQGAFHGIDNVWKDEARILIGVVKHYPRAISGFFKEIPKKKVLKR